MPKYTLAMCNLDMADTLEDALRGIIDSLDDRFEVFVVDGGSTDGSIEILSRLASEYEILRYVELPRESSRNLGVDRTISVLGARGDHIVGAVDADEHVYEGVIPDFVTIYEALDGSTPDEFVLHGRGIYVAPKSLHEQYLFPNVKRCEDRYFWRHLLGNDDAIWLEHRQIGGAALGYNRGLVDRALVNVEEKATDFQFGVTLSSCIEWTFERDHPYDILELERGPLGTVVKRAFDLATYPVAYLMAVPRDEYEIPPEFREKGAVERRIVEERQWLGELESAFGFEVDRTALLERGRELFVR